MEKKVNSVRKRYSLKICVDEGFTFSPALIGYDSRLKLPVFSNGVKYIIGVDEAGRGPLAGPVAVAAVAARMNDFHNKKILSGIKDSKKLSLKQREEWKNIIIKNFFYEVSFVSADIIDKKGITKAVKMALQRNLIKLRKKINFKPFECFILLDGALKAPKQYPQETIIKGDEKIPLISAASVMAKTHRDKKMMNIHKKNPVYRFDLNKGYGTEFHINKIKELGITPYHRKSFCHFSF